VRIASYLKKHRADGAGGAEEEEEEEEEGA
jgi:hypothetical protein